jgi:hypothetical protein
LTTVSERSGKRSGSAERRWSRKAFSAAVGIARKLHAVLGGERDDALPALG